MTEFYFLAETLSNGASGRRSDKFFFVLPRHEQFRIAASYVTREFARLRAVKSVAVFGSVMENRTWAEREGRQRTWRPKDVDLAVWIDDTPDLNQLRRSRIRALDQLLAETGIGVAHHQVDVFLLDSATGGYLGRLCCFNQCPKGKPECKVSGCGAVPFLKQHEAFRLHGNALAPSRISVLYDRTQPGESPVAQDVAR